MLLRNYCEYLTNSIVSRTKHIPWHIKDIQTLVSFPLSILTFKWPMQSRKREKIPLGSRKAHHQVRWQTIYRHTQDATEKTRCHELTPGNDLWRGLKDRAKVMRKEEGNSRIMLQIEGTEGRETGIRYGWS